MRPLNKNSGKVIVIVILILLFSLTFRIDLNNPYPKGADTYDLYALSKNVQEKGYVVWNVDFLTALGLTSFSYPPGGIIFLSEISLITGMDITASIIIWNLFLMIICSLLIYLISQELFKNNLISFLTVLIYLNSRFFIAYSTYFTARNFLSIFLLATLFLMLKKIDIKNLLLLGLIILISFLTHRATILSGIFILAFILTKILYKFYTNRPIYNWAILAIGVFLFFGSVYIFGNANIGSETAQISLNISNQYIHNLLNTIFSISMHLGILIILLPIGYFFLITKKNKSEADFFILTIFTLGCAFMVETVYFFYFFLPIMVIIIAYFLLRLSSFNHPFARIAMIVLIVSALILPIFITIIPPETDVTQVRHQTVKLTEFFDNQKIEKSIICNNHVIYCSQIYALSNNVTALTYTSGRTLMDKIIITHKEIVLHNIRSKIIVEDNILGVSLFSDTYTSAIINWNINPTQLKRLITFTNLGYVIDSHNSDSIQNRNVIQRKFGDMNQIYDNGLQQVKVIK